MLSATLRSIKHTTSLFQRSFAAVTVAQIKQLRDITGSPIDECKKALEAESGDLEKAREFLKRRGLASAQKRSARAASEGVIAVRYTPDLETALVAEVNCETDFVAKNDLFLRYVDTFLGTLARQPNLPTLNFMKYESGVEEEINNILKRPLANKFTLEGHQCSDLFEAKQLTNSLLQENIKVRKLFTFNRSNAAQSGAIGHYSHMTLANDIGKSLCLVDLECASENKALLREIACNLAMQAMGSKPEYIYKENIPANILEAEKEKAKEQLAGAIKNKPANVVDRMIEGKLKKYFEESVLYFQEYMVELDSGKTVETYLKEKEKQLGGAIKINRFKIVGIDNDD